MKSILKIALVSLCSFNTLLAAETSCDKLMEKLQGSMNSPAVLEVLIPELANLKIDCSDPKAAEQQIFGALWELEKNKKLDSSLLLLVRTIRSQNIIPALTSANEGFAVATLSTAVKSELYDRGFYTKAFLFKGWESVTKSQDKFLSTLPRISSFKSSEFKSVFKKITNMSMTSVANAEVLLNNSRSFEKRIELIKKAKQSIKLATWGFYDDRAGKRIADELIQAARKKVKVQLLVDYHVSLRPGYGNELNRMKSSGVEVIGWKSEENPFYGMHSKFLVVDDQLCLEGGRNIGDLYLENNKWSDLDVYHEGAIAEIVNPNIFARLWNEQIDLQNLSYKRLSTKSEAALPSGETGTFMSDPQFKKADAVSNMTVYSIMNAKHEIEIANAYFISTPGIKKALAAAIKRGVKVSIYSNSMQSVDEPIVAIPIQRSLKEMFNLGAQIYVKSGQTLHTKIFKADDMSWFGSYNLHPRSGRYELEKLTVTTDDALTRDLDKAYGETLRLGKKVTSARELDSKEHVGMDILFAAIFNQL